MMNSSDVMVFPGFTDPGCSKFPPTKLVTDFPSCSKYPPSKVRDFKFPPSKLVRDPRLLSPSCSNYAPSNVIDNQPSCSKYPPRKVVDNHSRGSKYPPRKVSDPSCSKTPLTVMVSERDELVTATTGVGTASAGSGGERSTSAEKAAAALKNHSQAEKRRRERINVHLATLRTLVPGTSKMEKASLLAEVITHMKQLKRNATDVTKDSVIPLDSNEVEVVLDHIPDDDQSSSSSSSFQIKASVCCDFKHEILFDLKQSLKALPYLKLLRVEIGTVGGRMKTTFVLSVELFSGDLSESQGGSQLSHEYVSGSVRRALKSVIDSFTAAQELSIDLLSTKRRRSSCSP